MLGFSPWKSLPVAIQFVDEVREKFMMQKPFKRDIAENTFLLHNIKSNIDLME
jgi:hypothetical protein